MKAIVVTTVLVCLATTAIAGYVRGYVRSDGAYVSGHYRTAPDASYNNNFSTKGNYNPYSGVSGANSPTWNDRSPSYNLGTYGCTGRTNDSYGIRLK